MTSRNALSVPVLIAVGAFVVHRAYRAVMALDLDDDPDDYARRVMLDWRGG